MRKFTLGLAALALGACSTASHNDHVATNNTNYIYAPTMTANRAPSQDVDTTPRWVDTPVNIQVGQGGYSGTQVVTMKQVQMQPGQVQTPGTCHNYTESTVYKSWDEYKCSASAGGKSPLWDAFYSADKAHKQKALNDAILGAGDATAKGLIDNHVFDRKPRSWDDFASSVRDAASRGYINKGAATQILVDYGVQNMQNLGYADTTNCQVVHHTNEPVPVEIDTPYSCMVWTDGYNQVTLNSIPQNVNVNVSKSVLQSFEQDTVSFNVSYNGRDVSVNSMQGGPYNEYNFTPAQTVGAVTTLSAIAVGRNQVNLPADIVTRAAVTAAPGNSADFYLQTNTSKYKVTGPADQILVQFYTRSCPLVKKFFGLGNGLASHCATINPGWSKSGWMQTVTNPSGETHIKVSAPNTMNTEIYYKVLRRNNPYYNANATSETRAGEARGGL